MKIAHITATFPPYYSGTGMVCYHNALGLARRGHQVTVITANHPQGQYDYPSELTVRRLPVAYRIGNAPLLPALLALRDFDIIHLHYPFIFGDSLLWLAAQLRGIPYVLTHHNDLIGEGLRQQLFRAYSAATSRLLFHSAKRLIAVSLDHARNCQLGPFFRRRWSDVIAVPNGVDAELFRPGLDGAALRQQLDIPANVPVVLFVGVLDRAHHFKGAGLLLRAFAAQSRRDAVLLIVGDGELRAQFEQRANALGIATRVRFVGAVPNHETPLYYAAADLAVLPSSPPESFGMVLIEAMACAKPVIASRLPGVRTVVSDGDDGLLVEVGDQEDLSSKLSALLADDERRRVMGLRGRAKVETKYAWPVIIPQLERLYEGVLEEFEGKNRVKQASGS